MIIPILMIGRYQCLLIYIPSGIGLPSKNSKNGQTFGAFWFVIGALWGESSW